MADEDDRETPAEGDDEDWFERALRGEEAATDTGEEAPDPSVDESGGADETESAFGFGADSGADFGADSGGEAPAFEGVDAGGEAADEFGFGNMPGAGDAGGGAGFEEEEFESAIPRIDVGIEGLDEMIQGGVPERSLLVVLGGAGTGKTTFGLQFLEEALRNDEKAVFITLEETRDRIVTSASEKGWPFEEYLAEDRLAIVDLDPVEMANSLTSIRNELPRLVQEFGASRLVLDSVSLLEMMYDDQATRRTEVFDFTQSLKRAGVTTLLTSEASESSAFASRHGIIEYLTDAVVVLRYVRPEDFRETRLAVEITKIRDANHSRETKPYEITSQGINVYRQANIF
ncbi:MAG: KaiC domain-containing protein [Halobacteriaceae archaeon]